MSKNNILLAFCYLVAASLVLLNIQNGFFWDTVQLGSLHADFYYSSNFSTLLLPNGIDSGHIPAFGMYIGAMWKLFGRTLIVSHLAMLPFAIGIVWQLSLLCRKFIDPKYIGIAVLLIFLDPTLLSQMTLISPDVPLIFFFLLGMNAILENKKTLLLLSVFFLFLTSMRGMMVSLCLLILDIYCNVTFVKHVKQMFLVLLKRSVIYLPALILFIAFSLYHYQIKGWIGFHNTSPWATSFESVGLKGFIFNIGILGWRLLDFGRIAVWAVLFILFIFYRKYFWKNKKTKTLIIFSITLLVILSSNMLWAKGLLGHRYLLPIYLAFSLLAVQILFSPYVKRNFKLVLGIIWAVVIITGNLWIYPPKIAQGWDATLAHLPYYNLRKEAINYIDEQNIEVENVATFFPNNAVFDYTDLDNDPRQFALFTGENPYVFYSNVFNISDKDFEKIHSNYKAIKKFENMGIYVTILKKGVK